MTCPSGRRFRCQLWLFAVIMTIMVTWNLSKRIDQSRAPGWYGEEENKANSYVLSDGGAELGDDDLAVLQREEDLRSGKLYDPVEGALDERDSVRVLLDDYADSVAENEKLEKVTHHEQSVELLEWDSEPNDFGDSSPPQSITRNRKTMFSDRNDVSDVVDGLRVDIENQETTDQSGETLETERDHEDDSEEFFSESSHDLQSIGDSDANAEGDDDNDNEDWDELRTKENMEDLDVEVSFKELNQPAKESERKSVELMED
ncbi:hypothetical protein BJ742DRAFT_186650 [Cladochytrium replicatum]|nr:hypothetical protein BJ742DRAFT_186650 [Cladochytrium replicatum]